MFIGYEIKSNQNQAKGMTLANDIRLTHAVLDPSKKGGKKEPVSLMVEYNGKQFIIAVLDPEKSWQEPLDLMFEAESEVKFFLRGSGNVHLTGYEVLDQDDLNYSMGSSSLDELEGALGKDDGADEEANLSSGPARKKVKKDPQPSTSAAKKAAKTNGVEAGGKKKKVVKPPVAGDEADSDDDDSDDEDFADKDDSDDDDDDDIDEDMSDDEEMLDSEELEDDEDSD